ncbi:DUF4112 domain-containing protein [Okeania sp. SIO2G5]|uniref:DUF4112 domain-containing protein n=1 Tax=Okeania sp. SIO2G5 TaxID=2607796 RepID=UPI0013C081F7|nr:DUF4112 domain-containing protein [Okeania sp. SIO2G5]NEP76480.1 DUF4112 domain-containing protein [Okeania sp. SIO2G5]
MSHPPSSGPAAKFERVKALSQLLDNAVTIPGTEYSVGLDPIIGLLPGGGDLFMGLLSLYIVVEGFRLGASAPTLTRMATNIAFEVIAGTVPVVGDIFDVAWKANARNVQLLEEHLQSPRPRRQADRVFFFLLMTALLILIGAIATVSFFLFQFIFQLLTTLTG